MSILCRVVGLTLREWVRSLVIWEGLGVELLLLHTERSQLRCFRHILPEGDLEDNLGHTEGTMSPNCPGSISGFLQQN